MSEDYNTHTLPLSALLESLLFVADGPAPISQFAAALDATPRAIEAALEELEAVYRERGLRLQRDKDRVQLTTAPQSAEAVEKFLGLESIQRLSRPAVETLAIVAYQQPVTRPQIEALRGVNCDAVIKSLLSKGLIEESGRTEGPGRPVLYATTPAFLQHFGLSSLKELPPLDLEALLAASKVGQVSPEGAAPLQPGEPADQADADPPPVSPSVEDADSSPGTVPEAPPSTGSPVPPRSPLDPDPASTSEPGSFS